MTLSEKIKNFYQNIGEVPVLDFSEHLKIHGISLQIRRFDLLDFYWGGNKLYKLRYFLEEMANQKKASLLTFGGAYSNHIAATAAIGKRLDIPTIGIIRGDGFDPNNPTLAFVKKEGMQLHFVSRDRYRLKADPEFLSDLKSQFGDVYIIPEGGSGPNGVRGASGMWGSIDADYTHIVLACGTGTTIAGLIQKAHPDQKIIGIPVFKNGGFMEAEIQAQVPETNGQLTLWTTYGFGGYAKWDSHLEDFISAMQVKGLPLDPIYTAKAFWGVWEKIHRGWFPIGSRILFIHTGGLQGAQSLRKG
jgi:1-aminocyclopropane-1-carboxylate deaminase